MKKPELLIPAGGMETLKVAVNYGADAVYMGGSRFGLRAKADNFTYEEMKSAVAYAHAHNVKVYVTVNVFAHNEDIEGIKAYFKDIRDIGIDAVLIADPGVFSLARQFMPEIEIHISTQANNTNYMTYRFWHDMGVKRVVCARELSLREIKEIRQNIPDDLEIEAFVHGAMCISYSGRCLLSNYFTGRDANKGACTHPCRWKYAVMEETRPGEYLPVEEDDRGTYIFNSKDLCMIDHIPDLVDAGIQSLKVEGRMKTSLYVAVAARTYREAIDDYFESPELYESKLDHYREEIASCTMRDFTTGFYYGKPKYEDQIYDNNTYIRNAVYIGTVEECVSDDKEQSGEQQNNKTQRGTVVIHQKNKFSVGDELEVMLFNGTNKKVRVEGITDEYGVSMESAPHPKQKLYITLSDIGGISEGVILRTV
ncbi:MAG: U32 family peptidase [Eubacterium sp.]|nr:U32 family peptidase [Eubacterium sp.]